MLQTRQKPGFQTPKRGFPQYNSPLEAEILVIVVLTTVPNKEEGEALAAKIVEGGLAACVQILPNMTSVYLWEGEVQKEPEHLLLIKTLAEKWESLRDFVTANHSYSVPEIVALDAERVSEPYLAWMHDVLR